MKNVLLLALLTTFTGLATAANYAVDGSHTFALFKVAHLGVGDTYGQFRKIEGQFDLEAGKFEFTIRTASLDSNDEKRDEHLKGPDFFNIKQFPVITFKSSAVKPAGKDSYEVKGNLMIHGKSQEVTITVRKTGEGKDPWGNYRQGIAADFAIKRSAFGMNYMADLIGDEVKIMFASEGIKK